MRRLPILIGALALATTAFAADDPIAVRQALMDNNGAAAALAGGVMKDEVAYSPVVGKAVIQALVGHGACLRQLLPRGERRSGPQQRLAEDLGGCGRVPGRARQVPGRRRGGA